MEQQVANQTLEIKSLRNECSDLSKKLTMSTTLLNERDALYQDRIQSLTSEKVSLDAENRELLKRMKDVDAKERVQKERRSAFRKDVEELENACKMLKEREEEVETKAEDIDRITKSLKRTITELESKLSKKSNELLENKREYDSFKENQSKRYDAIREELNQSVSQTEYDILSNKNNKLQERINIDMVSVESVGKLNATIESLERSIKYDYIPLSQYETLLNEKELLDETVKVIEDNLGPADIRVAEVEAAKTVVTERADQFESELSNARGLIEDLTSTNTRLESDLEISESRVHELTTQVCELETSKASLLMQLGNLKGQVQRDSTSALTRSHLQRKAESKSETLYKENLKLNEILNEKNSLLRVAEENIADLEKQVRELYNQNETSNKQSRIKNLENQILSNSVIDLTARTQDLGRYVTGKQVESQIHNNNIPIKIPSGISSVKINGIPTTTAHTTYTNTIPSSSSSGKPINNNNNNNNSNSYNTSSENLVDSEYGINSNAIEINNKNKNNFDIDYFYNNDDKFNGDNSGGGGDTNDLKSLTSMSTTYSNSQHPMEDSAVQAIARRYVNGGVGGLGIPQALRNSVDSLRTSVNSLPSIPPPSYSESQAE